MSRSLLFLTIIALLVLGYVTCNTNIDVSVSVNGHNNHDNHNNHEEMAPEMEESDDSEESDELVGSGYGSCKFNGKSGTCMDYTTCKGVSTTLIYVLVV